jgi:hypothetical protein
MVALVSPLAYPGLLGQWVGVRRRSSRYGLPGGYHGDGPAQGRGWRSVSAATAGTDHQAAISATGLLKGAGGGSVSAATAGTDYQAAITATGSLKGAGSGSVSAATAGTDYFLVRISTAAPSSSAAQRVRISPQHGGLSDSLAPAIFRASVR